MAYDKFELDASVEEIRNNIVFSLLGPAPLASSQTATTPGIFHFENPGGVEETSLTIDAFIAAVFDNVQFAITRNIEFASEFTKISSPTYAVVGGITRNSIVVQRFADLLQKPVMTSKSFEATIQGLLVICDVAAKRINSIDDLKARNQTLQLFHTLQPRESMKLKMLTRYQTWQNLFEQFGGS